MPLKNKVAKRKKNTGNKKVYRPLIAKTIPLASQRPKKVFLKFRKYFNWRFTPTEVGGTNPSIKKTIYVQIAGNSIYDILEKDGNLAKDGQHQQIFASDSHYAPNSGNRIDVESYNDWKTKFQNFTVLSSKLTATAKPYAHVGTTKAEDPTTLFIIRSSDESDIGNSADLTENNVQHILNKPYCKRRQMIPAARGRKAQHYVESSISVKNWFTVGDVADNKGLRGAFPEAPQGAAGPERYVSYLLGIVPTLGDAQEKVPMQMMISAKVEYVVMLTNPTELNELGLTGASQNIVQHTEL